MYRSDTFQDQVVLVTGGRSGIGYAIARLFLGLGAKVIICSRKAEALAKAATELKAFGDCHHQACDIRQTDQIQALAATIQERYGRLDILINNAGGQFAILAEHLNDKGWQAVINNNLNGTFYMTREMAKAFFIPQQQGTVVNIIADMWRGLPGMIHTGAARAGVENMTKTLAQEWSAFNIRLNCVAPGIIESSGLATYPEEIQNLFAEAKEAIPMGRFGEVEEVANTVAFLASPLASYITGITLYVDGAQHLNYDKMGLARVMRRYLE